MSKKSVDDVWEDSEHLETDGEELWLKCKTRQSQGLIFIDWLSWSVRSPSQDAVVVECTARRLAGQLQEILGGDVSEGKGFLYYERSLRIMSGDVLLGSVFYGGSSQAGWVHCQIVGAGWASVDDSARLMVHDLLVEWGVDRLSRVDLTRDCFQGEADFDSMTRAYEAGEFRPSRGVMPSTWAVVDRHRGSTRYVGRRENGKMIRGYEKGMQLARVPGWFRVELELRNIRRKIPVSLLLDPAAFFAGACKFCADLADSARTERVVTTRTSVEVSLSHLLDYQRIAYGRVVQVLLDAGATAEAIVRRLTVGVTGLPRRLRVCSREQVLRAVGQTPPTSGLTLASR